MMFNVCVQDHHVFADCEVCVILQDVHGSLEDLLEPPPGVDESAGEQRGQTLELAGVGTGSLTVFRTGDLVGDLFPVMHNRSAINALACHAAPCPVLLGNNDGS